MKCTHIERRQRVPHTVVKIQNRFCRILMVSIKALARILHEVFYFAVKFSLALFVCVCLFVQTNVAIYLQKY